jgi:hypothetical protein
MQTVEYSVTSKHSRPTGKRSDILLSLQWFHENFLSIRTNRKFHVFFVMRSNCIGALNQREPDLSPLVARCIFKSGLHVGGAGCARGRPAGSQQRNNYPCSGRTSPFTGIIFNYARPDAKLNLLFSNDHIMTLIRCWMPLSTHCSSSFPLRRNFLF